MHANFRQQVILIIFLFSTSLNVTFPSQGSNIDIIVNIVDNDDESKLPILQKDYYSNISANASFSKVLPVNVAWAGKYLRIEVIDKGIGISLENQTKLFKYIVQFDSLKSQNGGGNGLGLYISNTILEKHYGRIGVYSEGNNGNGSSFYIELPIFSLRKYSVIEKSSSPTGLMTNFNDGESLGIIITIVIVFIIITIVITRTDNESSLDG